MRVFISWSGERSRALAKSLRQWLKYVIQSVDPWMSERDIPAGQRWSMELAHVLAETDFGVLCLTPENVSSPWLHFEAGAITRTLEGAKVVPVLLGLEPSDIVGPLAQFQAVHSDKAGLRKLFDAIRAADAHSAIDEQQMTNTLDALWPQIEESVLAARSMDGAAARPVRPEREMLEELLVSTRALAREIEDPYTSAAFVHLVHDILEPLQAIVADAEVATYELAQRDGQVSEPPGGSFEALASLERIMKCAETIQQRMVRKLDSPNMRG